MKSEDKKTKQHLVSHNTKNSAMIYPSFTCSKLVCPSSVEHKIVYSEESWKLVSTDIYRICLSYYVSKWLQLFFSFL